MSFGEFKDSKIVTILIFDNFRSLKLTIMLFSYDSQLSFGEYQASKIVKIIRFWQFQASKIINPSFLTLLKSWNYNLNKNAGQKCIWKNDCLDLGCCNSLQFGPDISKRWKNRRQNKSTVISVVMSGISVSLPHRHIFRFSRSRFAYSQTSFHTTTLC